MGKKRKKGEDDEIEPDDEDYPGPLWTGPDDGDDVDDKDDMDEGEGE